MSVGTSNLLLIGRSGQNQVLPVHSVIPYYCAFIARADDSL